MTHIPLLLLAVVLFSGCNAESYEQKQEKRRAAKQAVVAEIQGRLEQRTREFGERYNADSTWHALAKAKPISTYALQKALIRSDGRPVLAKGSLFDFEKRGKELVLLFHIPGTRHSIMSKHYLVMELTCPYISQSGIDELKVKENVFTLISEPDYLIAAKIEEVAQNHQILRLTAREEGPSDLSTIRTEYIAKGQCAGIDYIGEPDAEVMEKLEAIPPTEDLMPKRKN